VTVLALMLALGLLAPSRAAPPAPTVTGPRTSERTRVTYVFHARAARAFRCAVDRPALRRCRRRITLTLARGAHVLRVRAVDAHGRQSAVTTVRVRILEPRAPEIQVGSEPLNVIAAGDSVWTENYGDGTVSILDVASESAKTVDVGGQPGGITFGAGSVWVSDLGGGPLTRLDLSGHVLARIPIGGAGAGVAVAGGTVYVADYTGGLVRVNAVTNAVLGRTALAGQPEAVAVGFGRVWVTNSNGTVSTLDPASGRVDAGAIQIGADADDVSIGSDGVWAVALYGQTLARIDPATRQVVTRVRTPGQASGVLADGDSVWVSNYDLGTVSRFSLAGRRLHTYRVGAEPRSLAAAGGAIWVANQASRSVSHITP